MGLNRTVFVLFVNFRIQGFWELRGRDVRLLIAYSTFENHTNSIGSKIISFKKMLFISYIQRSTLFWRTIPIILSIRHVSLVMDAHGLFQKFLMIFLEVPRQMYFRLFLFRIA